MPRHTVVRPGPSQRPLARLLVGVIVGALVAAGAPALAAVVVPAAADPVPRTDTSPRSDSVSAMVTARVSGRRVEDLSQRTDYSRTYANPDGTWTEEDATTPEQVQDAAGKWHAVDTSLVATGGGGWAPAYAASDLVLSGGGDSTFASLTSAGKRLEWRWPTTLPTPVVDGDTATYSGAVPGGGDLVVTATPTGFRHDIVLHRAPTSAVSFTIPVATHGADLSENSAGGLDITTSTGDKVASATPPVMWDASGDVDPTDPTNPPAAATLAGDPAVAPVATSVGSTPSGTPTLTLTPNQGFLSNPATVYPVTIDPSFVVAVGQDTWLASPDNTTSHPADDELRVGTADAGVHKARSFLWFANGNSSWAGKHILGASLVMDNFVSGSCYGGWIDARRITGPWDNNAITWSTQPPTVAAGAGSYYPAHGAGTGCPAANADFDVTSIVQVWADNTSSNYGLMIVAEDESNSNTWRKYRSGNYSDASLHPHINVNYNSYPAAPNSPHISPLTSYTAPGGTTAAYTSDATPAASASVADPDGGTVRAVFEFHTSKTGAAQASCTSGYVASGSGASCSPSTALADGTYYVRAKAFDGADYSGGGALTDASGWSPWTTVTIAAGTPAAPVIDCPGHTDGSWLTTAPGGTVTCTITATGTGPSAPGKISYQVDANQIKTVVIQQSSDPAVAKTSATVPATDGGHKITATATAPSGVKATATVAFGYGQVGLSTPTTDTLTKTTGTVAVVASGPPAADQGGGTPQVVLKWRLAASGGNASIGWTTDPDSDLTVTSDATGVHVTGAWDSADAAHDVATGTVLDARKPALLDLEVCVEYAAGEQCTWSAAHAQILRLAHAFGDGFPSTDVPGGQVALWTGEFATNATDASLSAGLTDLSISRTAATFDGASSSPSVFGRGWASELDGADSGFAGWQVVDTTREEGIISVTDNVGNTMVFAPQGGAKRRSTAEFTSGTWVAVDPDTQEAGITASMSGAGADTTLTLTDPGATTTTFSVTTAPVAYMDTTFLPMAVREPGDSSATTYSYDAQGRITRILAPVPTGITCPATGPLPAGCHALALAYASATTATTSTPGNYAGQVMAISTLVGSGSGPTAATDAAVVATYDYDTTGRLVAVTDPRNNLTTGYGYDGTSTRVAAITPPGMTPIRYQYNDAQQLIQITRSRPTSDSPEGTADLATIVYNIPIAGGATGLPDLSADAVSVWNQTTAPNYAVAVFGADQPLDPDITSGQVTADQWKYAAISYTDDRGYLLNTADYGAGRWLLTDTEYDVLGNPIRQLNQADIAHVQDGDLAPDDAGALTIYNSERTAADGTITLLADTEVTDAFGAARRAMVPDGSGSLVERWVRPHVHTDYDQGAPHNNVDPDTEMAYALPTTVTIGVADPTDVAAELGQVTDLETLSEVKTGYDDALPGGNDDAGWNLGLASTSTVVTDGDASHDITTKTTFNAHGQVTATRQPNSDGADAGTRQTIYYTSGTDSGATACNSHPEWAGLICQTRYAGNPVSGPGMVTTAYTYNSWQQSTATTETSGNVTRSTVNSYRPDGLLVGTSTTVTGMADSAPVPALTYDYDPNTGLQTGVVPAAGAPITTGYDAWGRQRSYTTGVGATTTTSYDAAGRTATVTDSSGTTTSYTYDGNDATGAAERRGLLTKLTSTTTTSNDTLTATITGAYDPAGNLTEQTLGGGITQHETYDTAGELTNLTYTGDLTTTDGNGNTTTTSDQPWLGWTQAHDAVGRVVQDWTPTGAAFTGDITGTTQTSTGTGFAHQYSYDLAGRLTQVIDQTATRETSDGGQESGEPVAATGCTIRDYAFDRDGNRTSLTTIPAASDGSCQRNADPADATTKAWQHDTADRITNTGYAYDNLGRTTTIPQVDTPQAATGTSPGDLAIGYYDTDTVRAVSQHGMTTTYDRDSTDRPTTEVTGLADGSTTSTTTLGYADDGDSPAWQTTTTGTSSVTEHYITGLDGTLVASLATGGGISGIQLAISDPHGDTVTQITLPSTGSATGIDGWNDTDEYGNPLNSAQAGITATNPAGQNAGNAANGSGGLGYGWVGAQQRATSPTGIILMGARLYDPVTGSFTSMDPVFGGNDTSYAYPLDPVNKFDITGQSTAPAMYKACVKTMYNPITCAAAMRGLAFIKNYSDHLYHSGLGEDATDNEKNAGRHFAMIVYLCWKVGSNAAEKMAAAHENSPGTTPFTIADTKRDRANNAYALGWYSRHHDYADDHIGWICSSGDLKWLVWHGVSLLQRGYMYGIYKSGGQWIMDKGVAW